MMKLESVTFMVDDVPENTAIRKDLKFFENNFSGIMPLEVEVNTGKRKGVLNIPNLKKRLMSLKHSLTHFLKYLSHFR